MLTVIFDRKQAFTVIFDRKQALTVIFDRKQALTVIFDSEQGCPGAKHNKCSVEVKSLGDCVLPTQTPILKLFQKSSTLLSKLVFNNTCSCATSSLLTFHSPSLHTFSSPFLKLFQHLLVGGHLFATISYGGEQCLRK